MTNSSLISKIEKAHRYAQEPNRILVSDLSATFHGGHDDYVVTLADGHWNCTCHTFETHVLGTCSHVMAMQEIMAPMLSTDSRYSVEEKATIED